MYGLGSRGGTPGGRFGGAFPVYSHKMSFLNSGISPKYQEKPKRLKKNKKIKK